MKTDLARGHYWEIEARRAQEEAKYYQDQLVAAHALLGRIVHQLSERWDVVRLTKYYPTDNLHGFRTLNNPEGKKP